MIYTVTFNPSLDYFVEVDELKLGEINRTKNEVIYAGGKGINVSGMLSNLKVKNTAVFFASGFVGDEIKKRVENKYCTAVSLSCSGMSRINVKVKCKQETEINGQGAIVSKRNIEELFQYIDKIDDGDYLVLAGNVQAYISDSIYGDIMQRLVNKDVKIIVDAVGQVLRNTLKYKPFLIKPNKKELEQLWGVTINSQDEVIYYAKKLQDEGAVNVLVSMDKDGAILVTEDNTYIKQAKVGVVVNSVGAGDSMVAGFLASYSEDSNYSIALEMAVCAGGATAFSEVLGSYDEVVGLMDM